MYLQVGIHLYRALILVVTRILNYYILATTLQFLYSCNKAHTARN